MPRKSKVAAAGNFRVNRKAFGLTYSCPVNASDNPIQTHDELRNLLDEKGANQYIIGKENHQSGKVHWHVYVKYDQEVDSRGSSHGQGQPAFAEMVRTGPNHLVIA